MDVKAVITITLGISALLLVASVLFSTHNSSPEEKVEAYVNILPDLVTPEWVPVLEWATELPSCCTTPIVLAVAGYVFWMNAK